VRLLGAILGDRVVDIGSGQGDLARELVAATPSIDLLGLELSAAGCRIAGEKTPGATFLQTNLLEEQSPGAFAQWGTHATCSEVLEHVDEPALLLRNAMAYLAPGARLVITVPAGPRTAFDKSIGHRQHFTKKSITEVMRAAGLEVIDVNAAGFPFFNLYRTLVLLRGNKLVDDVKQQGAAATSASAGAVLKLFGPLFKLNTSNSPFGWQLVAVARVPR
jgi:SAM-dependent methyltransferase